MDEFITKGLVIGYLYSILLSVGGVVTCEARSKTCDAAWSQGYAIASGMVTTFLAYFVTPAQIASTRSRSNLKPNLSEESDEQTP